MDFFRLLGLGWYSWAPARLYLWLLFARLENSRVKNVMENQSRRQLFNPFVGSCCQAFTIRPNIFRSVCQSFCHAGEIHTFEECCFFLRGCRNIGADITEVGDDGHEGEEDCCNKFHGIWWSVAWHCLIVAEMTMQLDGICKVWYFDWQIADALDQRIVRCIWIYVGYPAMSYVFVEDEGINDQRSIEFDVCSKYLPYDRMRRTGWFEFKTFVVC